MEVDGFEPPRPCRAQDLQSRAIDRYAIPPNFLVDRPGFEPGTEACKATVFPTIPTAQILATRDGIEPPLEVLETSALPLY